MLKIRDSRSATPERAGEARPDTASKRQYREPVAGPNGVPDLWDCGKKVALQTTSVVLAIVTKTRQDHISTKSYL